MRKGGREGRREGGRRRKVGVRELEGREEGGRMERGMEEGRQEG